MFEVTFSMIGKFQKQSKALEQKILNAGHTITKSKSGTIWYIKMQVEQLKDFESLLRRHNPKMEYYKEFN